MGRLTHRTLPGATYFVTTKAWQSTSVFQVSEVADIVVEKLLDYRDKGHYLLHEFVLMPNHLHVILTPSATTSLEKALQFIKGGSSHKIHGVRECKSQIWQSGFHESRISNLSEYSVRSSYVRFNPVTAKLVDDPRKWMYGSASGRFKLNAIPQGLKPVSVPLANVGPEGPTPNYKSKAQL